MTSIERRLARLEGRVSRRSSVSLWQWIDAAAASEGLPPRPSCWPASPNYVTSWAKAAAIQQARLLSTAREVAAEQLATAATLEPLTK